MPTGQTKFKSRKKGDMLRVTLATKNTSVGYIRIRGKYRGMEQLGDSGPKHPCIEGPSGQRCYLGEADILRVEKCAA